MRFAPRLAALLLPLLLWAGTVHAQSETAPPAPAASAASAPEPALPASAPEPVAPPAPAAPPPPSCGTLTARANAADLRAATALAQNKPLEEQVKLYDEALDLWTKAANTCDGRARERANRNLADTQGQREQIAERLAAGSQCETAHRDAAALGDLAAQALSESRWDQAALLFRKAENGWDLATEVCTGVQQTVATKRREEAEVDAHNAEFCAPMFDRARSFWLKFRGAQAGLAPDERQRQSQISETLWREAANQCRNEASTTARNTAQTLARERGTPWVATQPPAPPPGTAVAAAPRPAPRPGASPPSSTQPAPSTKIAEAKPQVPTAPVTTAAAATSTVASSGTQAAGAATNVAAQALTKAPTFVERADAKAEPVVAAVAQEVDLKSGGAHFKGLFVREGGGNLLTGKGRITWDNGDSYEGELLRGERHGQGEFRWASGQQYKGQWVNDRASGQGEMRFANGNFFKGAILDGQPQGDGEMQYASGDNYKGTMHQGLPEGMGTYVWKSGQRYEGQWVNDKPNGRGKLRFANGNYYEGQVQNGLPHGPGKLQFASGDIYEGEFQAGQPHGQGTYVWKHGDKYVGRWLAGLKEGLGAFLWSNGDRWEGVFKNDDRTEEGKLIRHGTQ